ncbi:MAG: leucine-rich repeat domain-containing protein [Treponema sp.]|nr:leucine-rich repeat domain-containing protein [Treponema sp.]
MKTKRLLWLITVAALAGFGITALSSCFSPWAGDPGTVTIDFGVPDQHDNAMQGAHSRRAVTPEEIPTLTHIITLNGPGATVTGRMQGAGTISLSVPPGRWYIRVSAESPAPEQVLRALGFGQVQVVAGRSTSAAIDMISATAVANHDQLVYTIDTARTDGREKIIVLTQDIYAVNHFTVGANRDISLVSDRNVVIRRAAGFDPGADMFVMQGNGTLRIGRYGITGYVSVEGARGAVLPPLEAAPPGDDPSGQTPAYTQGLHIVNNVLIDRGTATVTDIVIPPTVTSIAANAFNGDNLTSVIIPPSVRTIGQNAFRYNSLESVDIPVGVTNIGNHAFWYSGLTSVTIPHGVTNIGNGAFRGNYLTSVTIPASVTTMGTGAFLNIGLTSVTILYGVRSIGTQAFAANSLTDLTIPASVTTIPMRAFDRNSLTSLTIYYGVTSIESQAFWNSNLESVVIPPSVTNIGGGAFQNNPLTSITIGSDVVLANANSMGTHGAAFLAFYDDPDGNNRQGGTFVFSAGNWSRQ